MASYGESSKSRLPSQIWGNAHTSCGIHSYRNIPFAADAIFLYVHDQRMHSVCGVKNALLFPPNQRKSVPTKITDQFEKTSSWPSSSRTIKIMFSVICNSSIHQYVCILYSKNSYHSLYLHPLVKRKKYSAILVQGILTENGKLSFELSSN